MWTRLQVFGVCRRSERGPRRCPWTRALDGGRGRGWSIRFGLDLQISSIALSTHTDTAVPPNLEALSLGLCLGGDFSRASGQAVPGWSWGVPAALPPALLPLVLRGPLSNLKQL